MIIKQDGKEYSCYLEDDGTLDTVISVEGKEYRFSTEYASEFRDNKTGEMTDNGFIELCNEAIETYEMEETE